MISLATLDISKVSQYSQ